jgi:hypothetical protein
VNARVVRAARALCRSGRPACPATATQRLTSPHLAEPVCRCAVHLAESIESVQWALAEAGYPPAVTVTLISREG